MSESILQTVSANLLGSEVDYEPFAPDLIMYINSALMSIGQQGIGKEDFRITGNTETWSDFESDESKYGSLQECVTLRVKLMFDPPPSSSAIEALTERIAEDEWRLREQKEAFLKEG